MLTRALFKGAIKLFFFSLLTSLLKLPFRPAEILKFLITSVAPFAHSTDQFLQLANRFPNLASRFPHLYVQFLHNDKVQKVVYIVLESWISGVDIRHKKI